MNKDYLVLLGVFIGIPLSFSLITRLFTAFLYNIDSLTTYATFLGLKAGFIASILLISYIIIFKPPFICKKE